MRRFVPELKRTAERVWHLPSRHLPSPRKKKKGWGDKRKSDIHCYSHGTPVPTRTGIWNERFVLCECSLCDIRSCVRGDSKRGHLKCKWCYIVDDSPVRMLTRFCLLTQKYSGDRPASGCFLLRDLGEWLFYGWQSVCENRFYTMTYVTFECDRVWVLLCTNVLVC